MKHKLTGLRWQVIDYARMQVGSDWNGTTISREVDVFGLKCLDGSYYVQLYRSPSSQHAKAFETDHQVDISNQSEQWDAIYDQCLAAYTLLGRAPVGLEVLVS